MLDLKRHAITAFASLKCESAQHLCCSPWGCCETGASFKALSGTSTINITFV